MFKKEAFEVWNDSSVNSSVSRENTRPNEEMVRIVLAFESKEEKKKGIILGFCPYCGLPVRREQEILSIRPHFFEEYTNVVEESEMWFAHIACDNASVRYTCEADVINGIKTVFFRTPIKVGAECVQEYIKEITQMEGFENAQIVYRGLEKDRRAS
jgi:hypothetical protein